MPKSSPDPAPRASWATLFHQTTDAVFLLNPRRRLRYVNPAFETLARVPSDAVLHEYCHPRKVQKDMPAGRRALLQTLAAPSEAMKGRSIHVRRPVPPAKLGPPWWDISFIPLRDGEKLLGVLGVIVPVGQPASTAGGKGLSESLVALRKRAVEQYPLSLFDGESPGQRHIRAQAELAAKTLTPVWIAGAPGIGKETLARAIHYHDVTRERSFAAVDCAGLQPYLIRSLLFGHNGLAETGRVGTIYLKSPEALPPDLQSELIEWGELLADECRVVVGTSAIQWVSPEFRAAFGVLEIRLPALAHRNAELPALIAGIIEEERDAGLTVNDMNPEAAAMLLAWSWPGNFRELREVIRSAARRANSQRVEVTHLPLAMRKVVADANAALTATKREPAAKLDEVLEQVERRMIELALRKARGDQTAAADALGVYRSRLVRRIKALGLGD
jgi:transcriptional regulator with PAS, ATPase and Fis domain